MKDKLIIDLTLELLFWSGKKHKDDCEYTDKVDEGCYLCADAEKIRLPITQAILEVSYELADAMLLERSKPKSQE